MNFITHISLYKKEKQSGFTLVEMLIYMGILIVFLIVLTQIFITILDTQLKSESVSNVDHDVRYIYARLAYDIQRADSILIPAVVGGSSSTLQIVINGVTHTYSVQDMILQVSTGVDTINLNGFDTRTTAINFRRLGNDAGKHTIEVEMDFESITENSTGVTEKVLHTTIGTR